MIKIIDKNNKMSIIIIMRFMVFLIDKFESSSIALNRVHGHFFEKDGTFSLPSLFTQACHYVTNPRGLLPAWRHRSITHWPSIVSHHTCRLFNYWRDSNYFHIAWPSLGCDSAGPCPTHTSIWGHRTSIRRPHRWLIGFTCTIFYSNRNVLGQSACPGAHLYNQIKM